MSTRRRGSEELELDYGDDPLQDQDQSHHAAFGIKQEQQDDTKPKPIATLEVARKELVESTRPQIADVKPRITQGGGGGLPSSGLPANPLTGRVPQAATGSSNGMMAGGSGATNSQMTAVFISDMHWWTGDQHLVELCHLAGAGGVRLKDVSFSEHKVNGKSKGVAYIETGSAEAASLVKRYVDSNEYQQKRMTCTLVIGSNLGSPFRTLPREKQQPGSTHNPANQSSRPGLRIPPPCTYPYINSRDNGGAAGGSGGGGSNNQGGSSGGMGQKRGFNNNNGPGQSMGMGMGMGMGMNGQQQQNRNNQNQNQNYQSNQSQQPQGLPQQQQMPNNNVNGMMGMGNFGGMDPSAAMGMNMFGMNPFAAMGGMGGMGGMFPSMGFGGISGTGGAGGFDMSQFGGAGAGTGGMDFSQMGQFGGGGMMSPQGNQGQQQQGGVAKRSRTDGQ